MRTNNDVEAWNRRFNRRCGRPSLNLYYLIEELYRESEYVKFQIPMVEQRLIFQRANAKYVKREKLLNDLWNKYRMGTLSTAAFLKECATKLWSKRMPPYTVGHQYDIWIFFQFFKITCNYLKFVADFFLIITQFILWRNS